MTWLHVKHLFLRSPLEEPAQRLRYLTGFMQRLKHPELQEVYLEPDRIEQIMRKILQPDSNCIDVGCHSRIFLELDDPLCAAGQAHCVRTNSGESRLD